MKLRDILRFRKEKMDGREDEGEEGGGKGLKAMPLDDDIDHLPLGTMKESTGGDSGAVWKEFGEWSVFLVKLWEGLKKFRGEVREGEWEGEAGEIWEEWEDWYLLSWEEVGEELFELFIVSEKDLLKRLEERGEGGYWRRYWR